MIEACLCFHYLVRWQTFVGFIPSPRHAACLYAPIGRRSDASFHHFLQLKSDRCSSCPSHGRTRLLSAGFYYFSIDPHASVPTSAPLPPSLSHSLPQSPPSLSFPHHLSFSHCHIRSLHSIPCPITSSLLTFYLSIISEVYYRQHILN